MPRIESRLQQLILELADREAVCRLEEVVGILELCE
jgi:hypothetical protein